MEFAKKKNNPKKQQHGLELSILVDSLEAAGGRNERKLLFLRFIFYIFP